MIEINGIAFDILGGKDAEGNFCALIKSGDSEAMRDDAMRITIRDFLAGTAIIDGATSVANLQALLKGAELIAAR